MRYKQRLSAGFRSVDTSKYNLQELDSVGITITPKHGSMATPREIADTLDFALDAYPPNYTTPSTAVPIQFLQWWSNKPVEGLTTASMADECVPRTVGGAWETQEIVVPLHEKMGYAQPYSDQSNAPYTNFNVNFLQAEVHRFQVSYAVGPLEESQYALQKINVRNQKAESAAQVLKNTLEITAFNGYQSSLNKGFYGFLNAPSLPAYVTVATGASGDTEWSKKTSEEIYNDINTAVTALISNAKGHILRESPMTLAVSLFSYNELGRSNEFGLTAFEKLEKTYPNIKLVATPYLDEANGANNVFYLYSTGNNLEAFEYFVPESYRLLGNKIEYGTFSESYSCATAGMVFERGWACVRFSGI